MTHCSHTSVSQSARQIEANRSQQSINRNLPSHFGARTRVRLAHGGALPRDAALPVAQYSPRHGSRTSDLRATIDSPVTVMLHTPQ